MAEETRHLHLRGALGVIRTEMFDGREHLVVPVIALMDGVIHAVNASTPERVTTATLAKAAASWNGRPLVLGHPTKNGRQCSANEPSIQSTHHFGTIFNSRMQGPKLLMDAYVDPVRAEKIGGPDFIAKLRNGEQIEVSVGAYVQTAAEEGVYNGRAYKAAWLETHGDHLAFLPGGKGACSIEMGCGAHRAAEMYLVTAEGFELENLGGAGSGNFGHSGRPGSVGGSGSGSGSGGRLGANASVKPGTVVAFHTPTKDEADSEFTVIEDRDTRVLVQDRNSHWDDKTLRPTTAYSKEDLRVVDKPKRDTIPGGFVPSDHQDGDTVTISDSHWDPKLRGKTGIIKSSTVSAEGKATHYVKTESGRGQFVHADELRPSLEDSINSAPFQIPGFKIKKGKLLRTSGGAGSGNFGHSGRPGSVGGSGSGSGGSSGGGGRFQEDDVDDWASTFAVDQNSALDMWMSPEQKSKLKNIVDAGGKVKSVTTDVDDKDQVEEWVDGHTARFEKAGFKLFDSTNDGPHELVFVKKSKTRGLASRDCSVCGGTGQIKNEQKQEDCPSCEGSGKITAAENNDGSAVMEAQMKKVDAIKALTTCPCSGFVAADAKELEAFSEERLTALAETFIAKKKTDDEAAADKKKAEEDIKAAQATITELKAAAEKVPTEDEYLAKAPDSIRTLVAEKKSQDAQTKKDLVAQLKTAANGAYTEDELNAKPITELMKLATMAKVQPADYSGRALPIRAAGEASSYTPPDPYAAALAARKTTVN